MTTREVIDKYYDCINRGAWEEYLTLFSDDAVGDEQLAGHFAGIDALRGIIGGIASAYRVFRQYPQRIVVDGDAACVVWRCEGRNSHGVPIAYPNDANRQVIGANYFQVQNGKIVYVRSIHDRLSQRFRGAPFRLSDLMAKPASPHRSLCRWRNLPWP